MEVYHNDIVIYFPIMIGILILYPYIEGGLAYPYREQIFFLAEYDILTFCHVLLVYNCEHKYEICNKSAHLLKES